MTKWRLGEIKQEILIPCFLNAQARMPDLCLYDYYARLPLKVGVLGLLFEI